MKKRLAGYFNEVSPMRSIGLGGLLLYLAFLFYRMFFYAYGSYHRVRGKAFEYNLTPFKTVGDFFFSRGSQSIEVIVYNLLGNIIVFVPLGFLLSLTFNKKKTFIKVVFCSFLIVLTAESLQLVTRLGVFDIDDLILNLLGACVGYFIYKLIESIKRPG